MEININNIINLSTSFNTIHEEDEDMDESDEDTLAGETECCQLKEEVLKNNLSNKNMDYCLGKNSLSKATEYM